MLTFSHLRQIDDAITKLVTECWGEPAALPDPLPLLRRAREADAADRLRGEPR